MAHNCPFENNHEPLEMSSENRESLDAGYCPLCLHDFAGDLLCIECGHGFVITSDSGSEVIKVIPLED